MRPPRTPSNRASVLVGLLWCLALLSLVVISILHTSRLDLTVSRHHADRIQAHYLALAGLEKAKALLYHDTRERTRSAQNHTGRLYDDSAQFRDVPLGRGRFRILRAAFPEEGGGTVFGIADEERHLNANTASAEEWSRLPDMPPDIVAAILDWRDPDDTVTPGGAEVEHYASLRPPRLPRNGPFLTVRELLMVRGVTAQALLGDDRQFNGLLEPLGAASDEPLDSRTYPGLADLGWAGWLTVDSGVTDRDATGQERISLQSAEESQLTDLPGITADIARAIVAYRNQNRFSSLDQLLDVTAAPPSGSPAAPSASFDPANLPPGAFPGAQAQTATPQPRGSTGPTGPTLIDESLLLDIADRLTLSDQSHLAGVVNVNTAPIEVLACLPGMTRELAQAIVSFRASNGYLANVAWLLRVPGMTRETFRQIAPRVTVRSETFRILAEGRVDATGVRRRLQTIVRVGLNDIQTLSYREDDL
ncbi:MAG: helix-hairpin-helix domain-containing protein [Verrucomicrobiae bacterium]|nr:helix-hairpin-helix domain-containing protein [Verrucomicrobiae bacterium]